MHHNNPVFQIPKRTPNIMNIPDIKKAMYNRMKAQPPKNLVTNTIERETGLLRSKCSAPWSYILGMMGEVMAIANRIPPNPTTNDSTVGITKVRIN